MKSKKYHYVWGLMLAFFLLLASACGKTNSDTTDARGTNAAVEAVSEKTKGDPSDDLDYFVDEEQGLVWSKCALGYSWKSTWGGFACKRTYEDKYSYYGINQDQKWEAGAEQGSFFKGEFGVIGLPSIEQLKGVMKNRDKFSNLPSGFYYTDDFDPVKTSRKMAVVNIDTGEVVGADKAEEHFGLLVADMKFTKLKYKKFLTATAGKMNLSSGHEGVLYNRFDIEVENQEDIPIPGVICLSYFDKGNEKFESKSIGVEKINPKEKKTVSSFRLSIDMDKFAKISHVDVKVGRAECGQDEEVPEKSKLTIASSYGMYLDQLKKADLINPVGGLMWGETYSEVQSRICSNNENFNSVAGKKEFCTSASVFPLHKSAETDSSLEQALEDALYHADHAEVEGVRLYAAAQNVALYPVDILGVPFKMELVFSKSIPTLANWHLAEQRKNSSCWQTKLTSVNMCEYPAVLTAVKLQSDDPRAAVVAEEYLEKRHGKHVESSESVKWNRYGTSVSVWSQSPTVIKYSGDIYLNHLYRESLVNLIEKQSGPFSGREYFEAALR